MTALINAVEFPAIITECTNLWEFSYFILFRFHLLVLKEWTLNVDVDEVYDKTRMIPKTAKLQGIKEGRTIVLLTIGARALKSDS